MPSDHQQDSRCLSCVSRSGKRNLSGFKLSLEKGSYFIKSLKYLLSGFLVCRVPIESKIASFIVVYLRRPFVVVYGVVSLEQERAL